MIPTPRCSPDRLCDATVTRPGGEVVRCRSHDGPWHVGVATDVFLYRWPRDPAVPFPMPRRLA